MKCIFADLRRAITGRWFLIAVFVSALLLWLSIGPETWGFLDMLQEENMFDLNYFLQNALSGQLGLLLLPALSALPYGAEPLNELHSGAFRSVLFRTGRKTYITGKVLACFTSGLCVQACAFFLLTTLLFVVVLAFGGETLSFLALPQLFPTLFGRMLCGGNFAMMGCTIALITETSSAAMIAPLCIFYALTMIATRFFPENILFSPLAWQSLPLLTLLIGTAVFIILTYITLYWEVQKHV